jgi:penicillin-binding protein 1A
VLHSRGDPEAAVAAIDPRTGDVRAIAEKKDGGYKKGGLNLARDIYRNSGSTIKPFTLAAALMHGHSLDEGWPAPECISLGKGYRPCNAESGSSYQTLRTALVESINTVYAPLAVRVGLKRVIALARESGMDIGSLNCFVAGQPCPSFSLGVPTNALGEATAYSTLVAHGVHHTPNTLVTVDSSDDGSVFDNSDRAKRGNRVMPRKVADEVADVMGDVVDHGTGTAARQPFPVYGKTGTTDHFLNAWFTGCTPTLCISVWMGYDKEYLSHGRVPHSMKNVEGNAEVFGGTLPAQIFAKTFSDYRILKAPKPKASPSASASITPSGSRPTYYRPQPQPSVRRTTVRRTSSPRPAPSSGGGSPAPSARPSPSRSGLLPSPP